MPKALFAAGMRAVLRTGPRMGGAKITEKCVHDASVVVVVTESQTEDEAMTMTERTTNGEDDDGDRWCG